MPESYTLTLPARTPADESPRVREVLEKAQRQVGFLPNMYAVMVNSPGLLDTYLTGYDHFRRDSGFTPAEQEVVFLTISRENACHYCVAAHSFLADKASQVPPAVTDAIRDGSPIPDPKLAALSDFTRALMTSRGWPTADDVQAFLGAGYGERHILEIILAIGVKTLSNWSNHLFRTPLDEMFAGRAWERDVEPAGAA